MIRLPRFRRMAAALLLALPLGCTAVEQPRVSTSSPASTLPATRWDHRPEAIRWTQATLAALDAHGAPLVSTVPDDIETYCPAYPEADTRDRKAFWVGFLSALAKHESTWRPDAAGGGGRWIGLLQIAPATARGYGCRATDPAALKDGAANLSCAIRIAAAQVTRDDALVSDGSGGWRGMARDWAPFRVAAKRQDIASWTRSQGYCQ